MRDDFPWDKEDFRLKNIWIHRTVSWKIAYILAPHSTLAVNFILSSVNHNVFLQCESLTRVSDRVRGKGILDVSRGWGDLLVIECLTDPKKNHYMFSDEATSINNNYKIGLPEDQFCNNLFF